MSAVEIRRAWAFPGVGVKPNGYESALCRANPACFAAPFGRLAERTGFDAAACLAEQPAAFPAGLDEQYLSFAFACGMAELARAGGAPDCLAGNSFGVYPALVAAGALDFDQALDVLSAAYAAMERAGAERPCSLCAIVGLDLADCLALAAGSGGASVLHINSNNPTCHVFAGLAPEMAGFAAACQEAGAVNAALLPVALPYHHPGLTAAVRGGFARRVAEFDWADPRVPLLSTLDRSLLRDGRSVADYVARQIFEPIDWSATVAALYAAGAAEVHELGLGMSLTQNARFMDGAAVWTNGKTMARRRADRA